jgi:hypothetical protein
MDRRDQGDSNLKHSVKSEGGDFDELNIYSVHDGASMSLGAEQVRNSLSLFFTSSILIRAEAL